MIKLDLTESFTLGKISSYIGSMHNISFREALTEHYIGLLRMQLDSFSKDFESYNIKHNYNYTKCYGFENEIGGKRYPVSVSQFLQRGWINLGEIAIDFNFKRNNSSQIQVLVSKFDDHDWLRPKITNKQLKTIAKTIVKIPATIIKSSQVQDINIFSGPCSPTCDRSHLVPYLVEQWSWDLRFVCNKCGREYMCSCFKRVVEYEKKKTEKSIEEIRFMEKVCHICTKTTSTLEYCNSMYGSPFKVAYGPYIKKMSIELDIDELEAGNILRDELGVGWINEIKLVTLVRKLFNNEVVIHQGRPEWLSPQSLDIYLPGKCLAIEYQGEQHFHPVERFGGTSSFEENKRRDTRKRRLCISHGVDLVYFTYRDKLNEQLVRNRLGKWLSNSILGSE